VQVFALASSQKKDGPKEGKQHGRFHMIASESLNSQVLLMETTFPSISERLKENKTSLPRIERTTDQHGGLCEDEH
jgi:hypothetical protein